SDLGSAFPHGPTDGFLRREKRSAATPARPSRVSPGDPECFPCRFRRSFPGCVASRPPRPRTAVPSRRCASTSVESWRGAKSGLQRPKATKWPARNCSNGFSFRPSISRLPCHLHLRHGRKDLFPPPAGQDIFPLPLSYDISTNREGRPRMPPILPIL